MERKSFWTDNSHSSTDNLSWILDYLEAGGLFLKYMLRISFKRNSEWEMRSKL